MTQVLFRIRIHHYLIRQPPKTSDNLYLYLFSLIDFSSHSLLPPPALSGRRRSVRNYEGDPLEKVDILII